jgi:hypothetical protein
MAPFLNVVMEGRRQSPLEDGRTLRKVTAAQSLQDGRVHYIPEKIGVGCAVASFGQNNRTHAPKKPGERPILRPKLGFKLLAHVPGQGRAGTCGGNAQKKISAPQGRWQGKGTVLRMLGTVTQDACVLTASGNGTVDLRVGSAGKNQLHGVDVGGLKWALPDVQAIRGCPVAEL